MPWHGDQKLAIFLDKKRKAGKEAALRYMREHGSPMEKKKPKRRGR